MRRSLLRTSLLLLFYLRLPTVAHADIAGASVTPASLNAGVVTDVAVTFTSGVDVDVDGSVLVEFPTGFYISSGTTVAVTATGSTTALSVVSVSSTQLSVLVRTTKISAGVAFGFTMTDVTNPGEQTTSDFTVSTYDSGNTLIERSAAVSGIAIAKTALAFINVVPDSLNAGVTGTVTVAFTSAVRLPVGSKVEMTFPSDFTVLSSTLSSATNIDSSSTVVTSGSVVTVTIAGSVVSAGSNVSLKLDGVTNPGAKTTGTFAVATTDSSSRVFQAGTAVSAVNIVSTTLSGVAVNVVSGIAGAVSIYSVDFTTNAGVPVGGSVVLRVPIDYSLSGSISFVDSLKLVTWTGIVDGQSVKFKAVTPYAAGQHSVQVKFLENPGTSTTGSFMVSTIDADGFLLESASCAGVTIVPGSIADAVFTPQLAHPGIASRVDISFTTSAGLAENSLLILELPSGDYDAAVPGLSVVVATPASFSATASWNSTNAALLILVSSSTTIPHGTAVTLQVTALEMPQSTRATSTSASIQSWNAKGLKLDESSPLTLSAITAVQSLPCTWSTETPNPGITSNVLVTFKTNGKVPVGGKIVLRIPTYDFYANSSGRAPSVVFKSPSSVVATATWDVSNAALELVVANDSIPAYHAGVQVKIMKLDTPISVRAASRFPASVTTFDPVGVAIDGPSVLQMDAITAGNILGGRLWTAVNAVAGVTSDQTIELFLTGRIDPGGKFEFTLPDSQWSMAASGVATFIVPNLTDAAGSVVWDTVTRMMTVTLTGTTPILSYSGVTLLLRDVSNPPKETGVHNAYLTTRAADNRIIDGPDTLSVMTISRGALAGTKTWASITTTSASMQSDQRFKFTLSGALPSGSIILVTLPAGGWRMANSAVSEVSFSLPVSGVTAHSVNWSPTTYELRVVTDGDMSEGTSVELLVEDMINPFSSSVAGTCTVTTMLSDAGVVAESRDIAVNAITSDVLATEGSLVSKVATPGVLSTQTITFTTGGKLEAGAKFCITFPDGWTLMASTFASLTLPAPTQSSPLTRELNATSHTLCMQTAVAINQETVVSIVLTDILSPESVRSEQGAKLVIQSHLGGNVNTGSIRMNAIAEGALTGPLMWQTLMLSPGPVAGLRTSASLAFKTTGHVAAGGSIVVELPFEWVMASTCKATFVRPAVLGKVACSQNNISILMSDDLVEATDVNISFTGVYNPPLVRPEGVASCRTMAPDGGEIDASNSVTTGAIVAAVTGITNSGDHLTAVVGLAKVFTFEGSALAENDVVKFVDASTSNDANCGESTTGQSDVGGVGVKYLSANRDVSVKFSQSSQDGKRFAVCYKFGHNPFKLYAALGIMVKEIQSVSSSVGFPDIAVADFVKTWTFNGNGISGGDQVRWIDLDVAQSAAYVSTPPDCLDTSTLAKLASPTSETLMAPEDAYTRIIQGDSNVSLAFSAESSGRTFCLCFKFGSEPFMVYPAIKIRVNDLQRIETTSTGSDAAAVANAPKSFKLLGDGVALNDRLYFVESGSVASCEESDNDKSLRLLHVINAQEQSVLFADGNLVTTINFDSFAAGMTVVPCYQFGMEPYQLYQSIRLTVKMVKRYTGTLGSPQLAVAEVPEPLTFLGYGLSGGDLVRWILNGEEDCESNLASLTDLNTLGRVDTIPLGSNSAAVFNFSSVQSDFNPVLCYKFGEENFKLYSEISIAIGTIRAKSPQTGAKEIAVAGSRKDFTLLGTNLAEGDRVGWTSVIDSSIPCSNLSLLIPNAMNLDNDYLSYLTSIYTFGVALSPLSSGKRVYLCYGFGQEPFKLFTDLYVDVKSITNMRALMGSPSVAVAGALKTFLFDGDGVATGDFAKFVSSSNSSDCTDPGVTLMNIIKEYDDYDEMAMFLYEISARTATGSFQASDDTKSAGLKRVLCYRFGAEPFVFYENFHIDVKTVWRLRQTSPKAEGQNNVVVVNEPKQMTIDGVGISVKDTMKFVNAGTNMKDSDCVDLPAQGRTKQHLQVATDLTVALPFEQGSNGSTWVLCYKFDDEPFRLYASIAITVKQITALLDYTFQDVASLGRVATIGHRKQWKPVGSGIQEGDTVKIVPQSVTSSLECGQADANIATGTATMRVDKKMTFSGTISAFPASTRDVYHLCYQFQDEAFTYIRDFTLTTYGIISMDRGVVLESATTTAQVSGFRLSDTDEMGWTTSSTTCTTILGRTEVSGMKASLNFADTYSRLYLCYSFDRQPFDIFKTVTLTVAKAEIWTPQIVSVIADQTTEIVVSGTFGITQGADQVAWVPSDVDECSADAVALYTSVMQTSVTSVAKSKSIIPHAGEASFSAKYIAPRSGSGVTASDSFSTWKLCYRFGTTPDYIMFGDVLCKVLNIVEVLLISAETSSTAAVMKFQFHGVGMQDFDAAKWVDASMAASDADCKTLSAIGGSKISDVVNSRATFTFAEESSAMALCYRFLGHSLKLYANIPIQDSTTSRASIGQTTATNFDEEAAAAASDQFPASRDVATISLTLDKDIDAIPPGSNAEAAFKASFIATMATSLGIDASRIQITELVAGSVVVNFQLLASENPADPSVNDAVQDLRRQLMDTSSSLLTGSTVVVKNPATALRATVTSASAPATSSVAIQALGYQANGLFSFVRSLYSVTEKSSKLVIPILRRQGTSSVVSIAVQVQTTGSTAVYNQDYSFSASTTFDESLMMLHLRFGIGDSLGTIDLDILDNDVKEAHFKTISFSLRSPTTAGAALGSTKGTVVRIYDYGDGDPLVHSSFMASVDLPDNERDPLQGWQVVANGESLLRIDGNGIFAVDDVLGEDEYDQKCDLAAPSGVCTYACEFGGGLASSGGLGSSYNVLLLSGDDYVASVSGVGAFPSEAFTVSLWVKTTQRDPSACLYSYAVSSPTASAVPLALCNPSNLQLFINAESDVSGLNTFVNISDNVWHFVAVTWSSEDGRVRVVDNGMLVFDGGPYRTGQTLESSGFFVAGHLVLSSTAQAPCTVGADALAQRYTATSAIDALFVTTTGDVSCDVVANSGLKGQVQHVHVWSRILTRSELLGELSWPLRVVSNGLVLGWNFDTSHLLLQGRVVSDLSMQGHNQKNLGALHCSKHSTFPLALLPVSNTSNASTSSCLLRGEVPRLDAAFPCGPVFSSIWHFSAPASLITKLKAAYGGRLQYRLLTPSFNGSPRPRRGQVSIFSTTSIGAVTQISAALGSFDLPSASRWTYYSVVLREDFGWIAEPDGGALTAAEFGAVLDGATALWIRGDIWGYDSSGPGQEVVYLNDVELYGRW
ncbi:Concanavalin A-like lectin/glucanases superfamily [Phytophthora infestans]|uniref:Concanavalin A-like lectin/glucanases superfamily n=1 Tax=Phytophthora infestans TaxID=4787 RepID=A0A833SVC4_PHYIN|nr:Concanavalin A-like lectin/glucanases superfamily [Phytophthora infestans]